MPLYTFHCGCCGSEKSEFIPVAERDDRAVYCDRSACKPVKPGGRCRMTRVPDAPAFKIEGYAARNGYAAHVDVSKHK